MILWCLQFVFKELYFLLYLWHPVTVISPESLVFCRQKLLDIFWDLVQLDYNKVFILFLLLFGLLGTHNTQVHIKCYSFPLVLEIEESDEEVLSEFREAQRQVRKLSQDTKVITAGESTLSGLMSSVFWSLTRQGSEGRWTLSRPSKNLWQLIQDMLTIQHLCANSTKNIKEMAQPPGPMPSEVKNKWSCSDCLKQCIKYTESG